MAKITKDDLLFDYSPVHTSGDNPKKIGSPDNDLLNRQEEYEVVDFINDFLTTYGLTTKGDAHKVERLLHTKVPSTTRNRKDIKTLIAQNWYKWN